MTCPSLHVESHVYGGVTGLLTFITVIFKIKYVTAEKKIYSQHLFLQPEISGIVFQYHKNILPGLALFQLTK